MDDNFWLEIGISPRRLQDIDTISFKDFKERLTECLKDKKSVCSFFDVNEINIKDKESLKNLSRKPQFKEFYGLVTYLTGKVDFLREFFTGEGMKVEYVETPLLGLLYLYTNQKQKIIDSYLYSLYNKSPLSEIWFTEKELSINSIEEFRSQISKLSSHTKKFRLGKNHFSGEFFHDNKIYFCFEKAKREEVAMGFQEKKPIRKRGTYYIRFDLQKKNIEVRTGNPKVLELFSEILESIGQKVFVSIPDEIKEDLKEIFKKILTGTSDKIKITEVVFTSLEKGIKCETIFKQNDAEYKLSSCIDVLSEGKFIDKENIANIRRFTVEIGKITQTIIVDRKDPENIVFRLTKKGLSENKYEEIVRCLKEEIGIEIKIPYPKTNSKTTSLEMFSDIIGKVPSMLSIKEREIYAIMSAKGLLCSSQVIIYRCLDDKSHIFKNIQDSDCPTCGGKLQKLEPREVIQLNKKVLFNLILEKLEKIFGKENLSSEIIKLKKSECNLIHFTDSRNEFYLYLDCGERLKKKIENIEKSIIPFVKILIDKDSGDKDSPEIPELYAYNLIFDSEDNIKKDIEEKLLRKFEDTLSSLSNNSEDIINKIEKKQYVSNGDEFEDLVFPLLKSCFFGIYKWGKENKGKAVPDGLYGIKLIGKKRGFTLIYDCKYSENGYKLDIDEKRKARDYIKRTNQSEEIKSFGKTVSCYLVISNEINLKHFEVFADDVLKLRSWKGKVALFPTKSLLHLYRTLKNKQKIDSSIKTHLGLAFADFIQGNENRKIIIDESIIDEIINKAKDLATKPDQLEVLNFLKTRVEY